MQPVANVLIGLVLLRSGGRAIRTGVGADVGACIGTAPLRHALTRRHSAS